MKMYQTTAIEAGDDGKMFTEFASSADGASKARTRLKKQHLLSIDTEEVDVPTTRTELIEFMNKMTAHFSWVPAAIAEKLGG